ncbi:hypothetical protein NDU88_001891, partial [Pleurodeles waltl]
QVGGRHVGQSTIELPSNKSQGHMENKRGGEEDDDLELDYDEDEGEWEDGEVREEEGSEVKRGGGAGAQVRRNPCLCFSFSGRRHGGRAVKCKAIEATWRNDEA